MAEVNKIKYGIQNVHYAVAVDDGTGKLTYGTPVKWPGARAISLSAEGETTKWPADNVTYWQGVSNSGYEGDLTMARVIDSFHTDVLGEVLDTNGALVEYSNIIGKQFALMFQFEGDSKSTRHVLYNCVAGRPDIAGNTVDGSIEPEEETVTITASPRLNDNVVKASLKDDGSAAYANFFSAVYEPVTD